MSLLLGLALAVALDPDCKRADLTQAEMNDCALITLGEADTRLNRQWKRTIERFRTNRSNEDAERLRLAQRAWVAFRDAECDAEWPLDLGVSLDKFQNIYCRIELTDARTERLTELMREN